MEFTVFTEIFQRARQRLGSVGLGGNGQFVRLSALNSLGEDPWTDCLTEDLDLGIRLLLGGWGNFYCPTATVDQQAVTSVRRWLRQRARWFQGHMQCWKLLGRIVRSDLPAKSMADLVWYLTLPIAVMIAPFVGLPMMVAMVLATLAEPTLVLHTLLGAYGLTFAGLYILCFGQSYLCAYVYWMRGRVSFPRALLLAHAFEAYSHLWLISGWWAVWNTARRQRGWDKTARVAETATT
jgi:cellulose synthase/poly-beta-1,6-N-acetylglucosamine synthase-like glycosyltransferase